MASDEPFQSKRGSVKVPVELIGDLTPKERYLFDAVATLGDQFNDIDKKTDNQTELLNKILDQTTATNGKVKGLREDVDDLKVKVTDNQEEVKTVKLAKRVAKSKYFWVAAGVFFFVLLPLTYRYIPPEVILGKILTMVSDS